VSKQEWLDAAEIIDSLRIVPRLIVFAYVALFGWSIVFIGVMYFRLPASERSVELTAFCTVWLGAMTTAFPFVVKIYQSQGRDWDGKGGADEPPRS
jgi:hypothetical protein